MTLNASKLLAWVFCNLVLIYWCKHLEDLHTKDSKKVSKIEKISSCVEEDASLISKVKGQTWSSSQRPEKGNRNWINRWIVEYSLYKVIQSESTMEEWLLVGVHSKTTPIEALTTFTFFILHHLLVKKFCIQFYSDRLKMSSRLTARVCSRPWNEEIKEVKALKRCQIESCALFLKTWRNIVSIFFLAMLFQHLSTLPFMLPDPETSLCSWPPFKTHSCCLCLSLSQRLPPLWSPTPACLLLPKLYISLYYSEEEKASDLEGKSSPSTPTYSWCWYNRV